MRVTNIGDVTVLILFIIIDIGDTVDNWLLKFERKNTHNI